MVMAMGQSAHDQGVYGLVASLGSLVVRTLFQPVEEAAFTAFSKQGELARVELPSMPVGLPLPYYLRAASASILRAGPFSCALTKPVLAAPPTGGHATAAGDAGSVAARHVSGGGSGGSFWARLRIHCAAPGVRSALVVHGGARGSGSVQPVYPTAFGEWDTGGAVCQSACDPCSRCMCIEFLHCT